MMSIYERQINVNQLSIDSLPLRRSVAREFLYHNERGINASKKHIAGYDVYMNSKLLASMARRARKNSVGVKGSHYKIIDATNGKVLYTLHESQVAKKVSNLASRGVRVVVKMI